MGGQNLTLAVSRENPPDWLPGSMYHGPLLKNLRDTAHRAHTTAGHVPGSRRRPSARVPAPRSAFVAPRRIVAVGGGAAAAANGAGHSPTNAATRSKLPQPHATSPAAFVAPCHDCSPKSAARTASRSRRAATCVSALWPCRRCSESAGRCGGALTARANRDGHSTFWAPFLPEFLVRTV